MSQVDNNLLEILVCDGRQDRWFLGTTGALRYDTLDNKHRLLWSTLTLLSAACSVPLWFLSGGTSLSGLNEILAP